MDRVNELVDVVVKSKKGRGIVAPVVFLWKGRRRTMKEIGLVHPVRDGRSLHHIFEGTDGSLWYRLNYDTETLQWTLEATWDGLPN